jgi:hypothetical protein
VGFNDTEPQRAHSPGSDLAQEIRDSFQVVLDALDAARADLYAVDVQQHWPDSPPPSWQEPGEPTGDAGLTRPSPFVSSPPATFSPHLAEPAGHGPDHLEPDPPHAVGPCVVEPLWMRDTHRETVPPPSAGTAPPAGRPPGVSGAGLTYVPPPWIFPPSQAAGRDRTGPRPERSAADERHAPPPARPLAPSTQTPTPPAPARAHAHAHARNRSR